MYPSFATSLELRSVRVYRLGMRPYKEVWDLQRNTQQALIQGKGEEILISCEHPPVITAGRSFHPENLLSNVTRLKELGIEYFEIERGGDLTYHGPGQLVVYPVLDLKKIKKDVSWYMRSLEKVVIATLSHFGIKAISIQGKTGVWVKIDEKSSVLPKKISSMGIRISRWVTLHGLSLNIKDCRSGFSLINPCGFKSDDMISIQEIKGKESPGLQIVQEVLIDEFLKHFSFTEAS